MIELRKSIYFQRGCTVFTDADVHYPATIVANYLLIKELFRDKVIPNMTSIFDMFMARSKLSKTEESIIYYRFFMRWSYERIALNTGISVAQVQRLKDAALRQLRSILA